METVKSEVVKVKKSPIIVVLVVLVVLGLLSSVYFYSQYKKSQNPTQKAQTEVADLVAKVGKLYALPTDETPTVATVADKNKLADQPFFAKAENGDKVLIYTSSKLAILYRPSLNKLIAVAPVNLGQNLESSPKPSPSASASAQAQKTYKLVLLNGTKTSGLTKTAEATIKASVSNISVVSRGNALSDYSASVVVNLSGADKATAELLAKSVNGKVGELPKSENPVDSSVADFLIILGPQ